jgi:DNA ligase D-like protein (predicted ligase)/DNA ligase D-like protein (predicted polymerase)/DNA ligase D-like protein (predicted 3'-phosphoesterase)
MSSITTHIDNEPIKLSNLDKILWEEDVISKAELIQYYMQVWPYMHRHIENRPLTLIRYPDGINGVKFYSKNAAEHTPDWMPFSMMGGIKYLYVDKLRHLIYTVNLASLELHAMIHKVNQAPDTIIFDLDPDDEIDFSTLKRICNALCNLLKEQNYHPFIKTSGSKGLHIYVPITPNYTQDEVINEAKRLGGIFTDIEKLSTLKIGKERRQGKILIDIYRNHLHQTCVLPLSTRAKPHAPVSMPILNEHLGLLESSSQYNIRNAIEYLEKYQPWADYYNYPSEMKGEKKIVNVSDSLNEYKEKRDFNKTSEPLPSNEEFIDGKRYTIHIHDASNLHYDLRLEMNGTLKSWAIPKSLPFAKGQKRLAIQTEDHPLKYLTFEGEIPKGEYGGGTMWVFDTGEYKLISQSEHKLEFLLDKGKMRCQYRMFHTKEDQWLIELISSDIPITTYAPMLAEQVKDVPKSNEYLHEIKWDGIRATIIKIENDVTIISRGNNDITKKFPEIIAACNENMLARQAVIDGEIVSLDEKGIPIFANIISRMHSSEAAIKMHHAVFYAFDLLQLDGQVITELPLEKRQQWLKVNINKNNTLRFSEPIEDGAALLEAIRSNNMEGIIAKKKGSKYSVNKRSTDWLKIKVRSSLDVKIIGYTKGKGNRVNLIGSLHIADGIDNNKYLGKVGTGFDEIMLKIVTEKLLRYTQTSKPIAESIEEPDNTIWIKDGPICEVNYASITPNGHLREPVFVKFLEV